MAPHQPIPPRCNRLPTNLMSMWCWTVGCVLHQTGIKFVLFLAPNLIPIWCQTTGFALITSEPGGDPFHVTRVCLLRPVDSACFSYHRTGLPVHDPVVASDGDPRTPSAVRPKPSCVSLATSFVVRSPLHVALVNLVAPAKMAHPPPQDSVRGPGLAWRAEGAHTHAHRGGG